MSDHENQYCTSKVAPKDFVSGWVVALIIASTGLSVSTLFLGSEIALALGFEKALIAFGVSTLVLTLMCMATTLIGNRSRLSTYMILHFSFGEKGAKIVNFIFGVTLVGWFAVALELLAIAIFDTTISTFAIEIPKSLIIIVTSLFITITTVYGIRSIEKVANISIPILTAFLGYVFYLSLEKLESPWQLFDYVPAENSMTLFEATSILVGASILFPVLMADFSRFIKTDKQSLGAVLGLTIGTPLAYILSAAPSIQTGEVDIIKIMEQYHMVIPAFLLLFISTWSTNATNLYSASLTFTTIHKKWTFKKVTIVSSIFGTLLAMLGFATYLFDFLEFLGIFAPSISSIYFIHFFWVKNQQYHLDEIRPWEATALISWGLSSVICIFTYLEVFQLTGAYFIDSFLLGGLFYLIPNRKKIFNKKP
ncbi:purine-cytosine permease family protein [Pseudozobellia thermophila]|uniref:Cytosine permease n=1 Tax=Pseudozobellia thermophila TaxID=192903 RepID=A0A1M6EE58_9FLAO|nr:cytosine permease [Pseudozobellia thermophila]SHI83711.1 cytosine permease [Pseudozobellia thermophila]